MHPRRLAVLTLGIHADEEFSEVASFQHADEGFGRILQTIDDVFPIADAAVRDACTNLAQEFGIVLFGARIPHLSQQRHR